jgi:MerR family copper efflux transcriptional regulator
MQIKELVTRTGVSAHALRHYESLGLIRATRSAGGYRQFAESVVPQVLLIATCRRFGLSLHESAKLSGSRRAAQVTAARMIALLGERIAQADLNIERDKARKRELLKFIDEMKRPSTLRRLFGAS